MTSGPITSWQMEGGKVETVTDFVFLSSKITQLFSPFPFLNPIKMTVSILKMRRKAYISGKSKTVTKGNLNIQGFLEDIMQMETV